MADKFGRKPDVRALIRKAAEQTRAAEGELVIAPVRSGNPVRVKIAGLVCDFHIEDREFEGWAILKVASNGTARVQAEPSLSQRKEYLKKLPRFQMLALSQDDSATWIAIPAQPSDARQQISGPVPIRFCDRISLFDTIDCRFDGATFWFDEVSRRRDPAIGRAMRELLAGDAFPDEIVLKGMTPQERLAYAFAFFLKHPELLQENNPVVEENNTAANEPVEPTFDYHHWKRTMDFWRVRSAVEHAGAHFDSYWQDSESTIVVRMHVGQSWRHVTIRPDLSVVSAGICLSGMDDDFDLASIVSVFREKDRSTSAD